MKILHRLNRFAIILNISKQAFKAKKFFFYYKLFQMLNWFTKMFQFFEASYEILKYFNLFRGPHRFAKKSSVLLQKLLKL